MRRKKRRKSHIKWCRNAKKKKNWDCRTATVSPVIDQDIETYKAIANKYSDMFNTICIESYITYYNKEHDHYDKTIELIDRIIPKSNGSFVIELDDIENRLRYIWFNAIKKYFTRVPNIPLENYLLRMSLWELKHWLKAHKDNPINLDFQNFYEIDKVEDIQKLDLSFVLYGSPEYTFLSCLLPYERYLIYLRFTEDESLEKIACLLGHDKHTIIRQLEQILSKLKEKANGKIFEERQNSRRFG